VQIDLRSDYSIEEAIKTRHAMRKMVRNANFGNTSSIKPEDIISIETRFVLVS
jgi:hypothetical protein